MYAKSLVPIAAVVLTAFSASISAAEPTQPAWQEPDFVMEVVIAKAPRPSATNPETSADAAPLADATPPAWQEPGYVEEVVVVTASRSAALERAAARREAMQRWLQRSNFLGAPHR